MLRVGILMPRSTLYPTLGLDLLNGLKQCLKETQIFDAIKLQIDNIGFGIDEPEIYTKAEKMILQEDADVVLVCADSRIAEMLQPLFTACNKLLIIVNFGASYPDTWQAAPTTITHTLNFAFNAKLTGVLAASQTNKQAVNAISYFDGGYKQCYAMLNAHQEHGGIPVFNHITQLKINDFTLEPLANFLEANADVQNLLCLFSGDQAVRFYQDIAPLQKKYNLQLFVAPMMLTEEFEPILGKEFSIQQVQGFVPWHPQLENDFNKLFIHALKQSNQNINYFSLLGWDVALLLESIYTLYKEGETNAVAIVQSILGKTLQSPRGWIKIDAATQQVYGPAYLTTMEDNAITKPGIAYAETETAWTEFTSENLPPGERSSWRNTYLCI